jgi:cytochrome c peroxidase
MKFKIIGLVFFLAGIIACKKEITPAFTGFSSPDYFPTPVYKFNNNPITEDGFVLGRKLFYDASFSANNTISCGFCQIQTSAFTQHGHSVSHGIFDSLGTRNTPPILN